MGRLDELKIEIAYFEKAMFVLLALIAGLGAWIWEKAFQNPPVSESLLVGPTVLLFVFLISAVVLNRKIKKIREVREL